MLSLIQSWFRITGDRIKNPLIGAFISSWIIVNWKPLVFFFLSNQIIEDKIIYISENFSNGILLFWIPFLIAIFYILALPYINLEIDEILTSASKRNTKSNNNKEISYLESQKEIELKKIDVEKAKNEARTGKKENDLIEDLQKKIANGDLELSRYKKSAESTIEDLKKQLLTTSDLHKKEMVQYVQRLSISEKEISVVRQELLEKEKIISELNAKLKISQMQNNKINYTTLTEALDRFNENNVTGLSEKITTKLDPKVFSAISGLPQIPKIYPDILNTVSGFPKTPKIDPNILKSITGVSEELKTKLDPDSPKENIKKENTKNKRKSKE